MQVIRSRRILRGDNLSAGSFLLLRDKGTNKNTQRCSMQRDDKNQRRNSKKRVSLYFPARDRANGNPYLWRLLRYTCAGYPPARILRHAIKHAVDLAIDAKPIAVYCIALYGKSDTRSIARNQSTICISRFPRLRDIKGNRRSRRRK